MRPAAVLPFSNTLVLTGLNVYEDLKIDDPDKMKGRDFVFRPRGRDLRGVILDFASLRKVDFAGAQLQGASFHATELQGASFAKAQLQGASLDDAQLQGASLNDARLQGASLGLAELQGASLARTQLQGAMLEKAQLQGAWLVKAQLQGAELLDAQLQGASLEGAELEGAALDSARLQGASLRGARLQGAFLRRAFLDATDLSYAYLWRTNSTLPVGHDVIYFSENPKATDVRLSNRAEMWLPPKWSADVDFVFPDILRPWSDGAYKFFRQMMEVLPPGRLRDEALVRIIRLDCTNPDPSLASCDPSLPPPMEADAWRMSLEDAQVDDFGLRQGADKGVDVAHLLGCR